MSKKFYLAHHTPSRLWVRDWEVGFEKRTGIELINPFYDSNEKELIKKLDTNNIAVVDYEKHLDEDFIVYGDYSVIDDCDGIVVVMSGNLRPGTLFEIAYADMIKKIPIYAIMMNGLDNHPFFKVHCGKSNKFNDSKHKIFKSLDEFEEYIKNE